MHVAARDKEAAEWDVLRGRLEAAEAAAQQEIPGASSSSSSSVPRPAVACKRPGEPTGNELSMRGNTPDGNEESYSDIAMPTVP